MQASISTTVTRGKTLMPGFQVDAFLMEHLVADDGDVFLVFCLSDRRPAALPPRGECSSPGAPEA